MKKLRRSWSSIKQGDATAEQLLPLVYDELRRCRAEDSPRKSREELQAKAWSTRSASARGRRATASVQGSVPFFAAAARPCAVSSLTTPVASRTLEGGGVVERPAASDGRGAPEPDAELWPSTRPSTSGGPRPPSSRLVELRYFAA